MFKRIALLTSKIESTYGADPVPTGTDAMQVMNLSVKPVEADKLTREIAYPDLSTQPHILTKLHQSVSFDVEMKGSGAAGTAPRLGPLLRSCGFAETIDAGVDVQYDLVSTAFESSANYVNIDGLLHKLIGCRGNVKTSWVGGKYPIASFNLLAKSIIPTDTAAVSPTYEATIPQEINNANTTFSIDNYDAILHKLDADMGWGTLFRDLPNLDPAITLKERACKGALTADMVLAATYDFWTKCTTSAQVALALSHGLTAGNIVEMDCPKTQFDPYDYGDADSILIVNAPLTLARNTGDDECKITFK